MRVFISYTTRDHRDRALARQIYQGLLERDVDVFFAEETIRAGAEWKKVLQKELSQSCSHMLVILSAASVVSEEVRSEIELGRARVQADASFGILPLVTGSIENPLSDFNWIQYSDDDDEQFERIATALGLPPRETRRRPPSGGHLVPRLCDRREQQRRFNSKFNDYQREHPRAPQVYFLFGEEGERHESLVNRFNWQDLRDFAARLRPGDTACVSSKNVEWPSSQTPTEAWEELSTNLFGEFDADYRTDGRRELTPQAFVELTKNLPQPVVSFEHEIRSSWWCRASRELIERYLQFWSEVATLRPQQQFVVFFNLVLDGDRNERSITAFVESLDGGEEPPLWRRMLLGTSEKPRLPSNILVTSLPRLQSVQRKDVDEWFDKRLPIRFDARQRVTDDLFRTEHLVPMERVERRLDTVFEEYAEGRA